MKCYSKWLYVVELVVLLASPLGGGRLAITNLTWQQRWPWNGLVDITYSVECDERNGDGSPMEVELSFTGYDQDLTQTIAMKTLSGDGVESPVTAGGPYRVIWNAKADHPHFHSSAFRVKVRGTTVPKVTAPELGTQGTYLVIDLAAGPSADRYRYWYSEKGPKSGASKTTELWLRRIPAGSFVMGSPEGELGRFSNETQHHVTLSKPFYMGVYEVTRGQWEQVMGASSIPDKVLPIGGVSYHDIRGADVNVGWPKHGHMTRECSFLGKLRARTGLVLDLPTEAQWEYACRAGTTTALNSGKNLTLKTSSTSMSCTNLDEVAWYRPHSTGFGNMKFKEGGGLRPNAWGLYDMHGNAWEWCLDWYQPSLGADAAIDPVGADQGTGRISRGGGCADDSEYCRSAYRAGNNPDNRGAYQGFRIVSLPAEVMEAGPTPSSMTGNYVVVDLSGGASATSFPYRNSEVGPDVSQDACRSTELWLRRIPAGSYVIGTDSSIENAQYRKEGYRITLDRPYYLGVFEVTQKQWELVMGEGNSPAAHKGWDRPVENVSYDMIRGATPTLGGGWPNYGFLVDSTSFMGRLRAKTGLLLDLPMAQQWEVACRAGTLTDLNSGCQLQDAYRCGATNQVGRYFNNPDDGKGGYSGQHTRVGSYLPNAWGLYDMHGNVDEWCLDHWENQYAGTTGKIRRGGHWGSYSRDCISSKAGGMASNRCDHACGFRIAGQSASDATFIRDMDPLLGRYLVIDLTEGPDAPQYPYRFTERGPDLGSESCRLSELWLREIPAGRFMMGSPSGELGRSENEDLHEVVIRQPYYIGVFEVTQRQWVLVMGTNPSMWKGDGRPVDHVTYHQIRGKQEGNKWPSGGHRFDAGSFMEVLRRKTRLDLDLPTEAQWEYACRAGTDSALNHGKELVADVGTCSHLNEVGRYLDNCHDGCGVGTAHTTVGSYLPNRWGLYDMHGNVAEWCLDWYADHFGEFPVTEPEGAQGGNARVLRGGAWTHDARLCRSASRLRGAPDAGILGSGLRLVCNLPDSLSEVCKPEPGRYVVIDLSPGAGASSYPYHRSEVGPDLNDNRCRTTELWLREIPAGRFVMGSAPDERGRKNDEERHWVTLTGPFYMGVFEVTKKQWELVMGEGQSEGTDLMRPTRAYYKKLRGKDLGLTWPSGGHAVDGDSFFGKLQAKTGLVMDLPTEAQWEYACRAGSSTSLNSHRNITTLEGTCRYLAQVGRYKGNCVIKGGGYDEYETIVGSYRPNQWGLYDMHGNESEWCLDRYQEAYGKEPVVDPVGSATEARYVVRGGSWGSEPKDCRSAARGSSYLNGSEGGAIYHGFRVVLLPK